MIKNFSREYRLRAKVFLYPGMDAWHFVYIDKKISAEIKERFGKQAKGFGSIPVRVIIGETTWNTSIFPSKKDAAYLLPLKASVRKAEGIWDGDVIAFTIEVR